MAEVKVDITAARSDVQKFTTNNNELKTEYGNLKNNVSSGISEFGIVYFSELEKYVNDMHLKNDRYQLGANQYLDDLTDFQTSIVYNETDVSKFPSLGDAGNDGSIDKTKKGGSGARGGEIGPEDTTIGNADGSQGDPDTGTDPNGDNGNVDNAQGNQGDPDTGTDPNGDNGNVDNAQGNQGDSDTGGDTSGTGGDVGDSEGKEGDPDTGSDPLDDFGKVSQSLGESHGGRSTGDDIGGTEGDVAEAISEQEAEDLLAELLGSTDDTVTSAQGQSAAAGLAEAINGTGQDVHKGGVGLGALAAILGTIAAGGLGVGAAAGAKKGDNSLGTITDSTSARFDGKQLSPSMSGLLGEIAAGASGYTVAELMSGNFPEGVTSAMNAIDTVMNVVTEAGISTQEEMDFAMSGMPYQLAGLSKEQMNNLYLELGSLIDKYGGIENFIESAQARAFIEDMASAYDTIKNLLGKNIDEIRSALRGLLDPNNPNIGGIPVSKEVRDFILNFLKEMTGLSLEELLDGTHDEELMTALEELLEMLEIFKCLSTMTKEELRQFLYDLLDGKFPELCGITPFTAKTLKDYLATFAKRMGFNPLDLYNVVSRVDALRTGIKEYSQSKITLRALSTITISNVQEVLNKINRGELVTLQNRNIDGLTVYLVRSCLNVVARYHKCSVDELINNDANKVELLDLVTNLYKYAIFNGMFCTLKPDMLFARMNAMNSGKNFGLNGFTFMDIKSLKDACEDYAFKSNIKPKDLYVNKAHAGVFKQILVSNDIFIKLMLLFENLSDVSIQVLMNNLIIAWEEAFKERLQNLLNYANKKRVDNLTVSASEDTISNMRVVSEDALKAGIDKIMEVSGDEFYNLLLNVYQNKKAKFDLTPELIYLIKLFLLIISIDQKLAVVDLMNNDDAKYLIKELLPFVKLYPSKVSNRGDFFKLKPCSEFIGSVLGGYYPDLLGYSGDKYKVLVDTYYGIAQRMGLNVKECLGNIAHAAEIANYVANDQKNRVIAVFVREIPEIPTQRFMNMFILNSKK